MPQDWFSQFETAPKGKGKPTPALPTRQTRKASEAAPPADWFDQFSGTEPAAASAPFAARQPYTTADPANFEPATSALQRLMRDDGASPDRSTAADVGIGAVKGAANTAIGLGAMVHRVPGVTRAVDAAYGEPGVSDQTFAAARDAVRPTDTAQRVGFAGEQLAEFFVPGGGASKLVQVPKSALTTLAQTGSVADAGVSGALTAAVPSAATIKRGVNMLKRSATNDVARALAPTKEWAKTETARLAPEMLDKGVRGSREAMLQQAKAASKEVGARIGAAYEAAAANGQTVNGLAIRGELQFAKEALMVPGSNGKLLAVPGTEGVLRQLDDLEAFVTQLGDDVPVDKAHKVKVAWDQIAAKAGLFGPKATSSATDNASAWAIREGAGSFRRMLEDVPDVAALNKEYQFWTGLKKVLKETEKRKQGQSGGLFAAGGAGAAAVATAASGGSLGAAFLTGWAGKKALEFMQSPAFRMASAQTKDALANALASGSQGELTRVMSRIVAASPAAARNALQ